MATYSVTKVKETVFGDLRVVIATVVGGTSDYASGGYAVGGTQLGLSKIHAAFVNPANAVAGRLIANWIPGTSPAGKIQVCYPTGGATASPAALADPISTTGASTASAVDATQPNITPGRGKEVADATDLTGATWQIVALGE